MLMIIGFIFSTSDTTQLVYMWNVCYLDFPRRQEHLYVLLYILCVQSNDSVIFTLHTNFFFFFPRVLSDLIHPSTHLNVGLPRSLVRPPYFHSQQSFRYLLILSSHYNMPKPPQPLFLHFPRYFCHFRQLSDSVIPYLVELCDHTDSIEDRIAFPRVDATNGVHRHVDSVHLLNRRVGR